MWEAEPWLPGVLSPALSPLLWLAGLAIAWLAAAAGGQPFRGRGFCWLVLGQSLVYAVAFSSSSIGRKGRFNPNDAFCVAGALAAAMAVAFPKRFAGAPRTRWRGAR